MPLEEGSGPYNFPDGYEDSTEDHTVVRVEGVQLNKKNLTFSIEKIMEGTRLNPSARYVVTPPQKLNAVIAPDQEDNKKLVWETNDVLTVDQGGSVEVIQDSAWIQALVVTDESGLKDNKYALSTAAGSSSSGSGRPKAVTEAEPAGAWLQDNTGWWFRYADGSYPKSAWVQLGYNGGLEWYHFDEVGYMQTGWFTEQDGNRYFLLNVSDGTQGHMVTG